MERVPAHIFREYDIRGIADQELSSETVHLIGRAYGSYLTDLGIFEVTVGGDARHSTPRIKEAAIAGLREVG
ncbi:MAG: phosphomannomutase, partial [Synergistaceae bacterium]|nr:phosphomannomutase [Synergistaceae bacterium]